MIKENKMGVLPVNKLLITMSLPMMISMLVQALYNIVDSIFVAQIEEKALTAVSLAFPIQTLMIAVGVGTSVGINALLSRFLGEKEFGKANDVAKNGIFADRNFCCEGFLCQPDNRYDDQCVRCGISDDHLRGFPGDIYAVHV